MIRSAIFLILFSILIDTDASKPDPQESVSKIKAGIELIILGTVQDAGSPHIACRNDCCKNLFTNPDPERMVVSLGVIDHDDQKTYLFEATPDISRQCKALKTFCGMPGKELPDAIFLTHAHIGHYSGLMYLGKEAVNTSHLPVYVMPGMKSFLETNGPWDQLLSNGNIELKEIQKDQETELSDKLIVTPVQVPHRDEYSETVGYLIQGPQKKVLFIPDIDKWEKWDKNITELIREIDLAFVDATFYDEAEVNYRDMSDIPHPFVLESMKLFKNLSGPEKEKIHFIHLNHTNPLLNRESDQFNTVVNNGFRVSSYGEAWDL